MKDAGQSGSVATAPAADAGALLSQELIGVCEAEIGGRILRVNRAFGRLTGRDPDSLRGTSLNDLMAYAESARALRRELGKSDRASLTLEHQFVRPDGSVAAVHSSLTTSGERGVLLLCVAASAREARLAAEVDAAARAEASRRELLRRLATAREDEQRKTARDLHDQVGQTLSALMLAIQVASQTTALPTAAALRLRDALRLAEELARDLHELASRLRPALLDDLGLHAALRQLLAEWTQRTKVPVDFQATWLERQRLPSEVETVLFRVVQEGMSNVARHARAHRVTLVVERHEGDVIAVVEDDGVGFDPASPAISRLGLEGMRERIMLVGGTLDIESEPGRGTTVIARVPVAPSELAERAE